MSSILSLLLANGVVTPTKEWPELGIPLDPSKAHVLEAELSTLMNGGQEGTVEFLTLCRYAVLRLNGTPAAAYATVLTGLWPYVVKWLNFLTKPATHSHYFEEVLALDPTFYANRNLQPKPVSAPTAEPQPNWWPLPWLERPEELTAAELELALAVFKWDAQESRFAWWVTERPYRLHDIQRLCLRRYCYPLLAELRRARKADRGKFDGPPYRAVEWERLAPRLTGFMAVGLLALVGLEVKLTV